MSRVSSWALKAEETVLKVFGPASLPFFFSFTTWVVSEEVAQI